MHFRDSIVNFNLVFNNPKQVDFILLERVVKRKVMYFLDGDIIFSESKRAVTNLKTHTAPGLNEVPPDVFNFMNNKHPRHILKYQ